MNDNIISVSSGQIEKKEVPRKAREGKNKICKEMKYK